ncbi:MAG TPA: hypothetical protein VES42_09390 [Pilimelia sp.]|nr:hypothetical protein [Pilimelia sp.]
MVELSAITVAADLTRQYARSARPDSGVAVPRVRTRRPAPVPLRTRTACLLHSWADRLAPT